MEIPKVTESEPYIEFKYTKNGELKLTKTSGWWGGIDSGFSSSDGSEGNTCYPKDLNKYIKHFNEKRVSNIKKEIEELQEKLCKTIIETERRVSEV